MICPNISFYDQVNLYPFFTGNCTPLTPVLSAFSTCARFWHKSKNATFFRDFWLVPDFWHKSIDFCAHEWKTRRRLKQTKIFDWRNGPRPNGTYVTVRTSTWHAGITMGFVRSSNHIVLPAVPWLVPNVWHKSKIIGPSETPWGDFWLVPESGTSRKGVQDWG